MKTKEKKDEVVSEKNGNSLLKQRIRQTKEQAEIIKAIRKANKVYVWAECFDTHGTYVEVIKGSLIDVMKLPLKHGIKSADYHMDGNNLFLG